MSSFYLSFRSVYTACALALTLIVAACGETYIPASVGPSALGGHTFEVTNIEGLRWYQSGAYLYNLTYRITNLTSSAATYTLRDFTVFGPGGEVLAGYRSLDRENTVSVDAVSKVSGRMTLNGDNPGHPYAERVQVHMTFRSQDGKEGVLTDEDIVLHAPQNGRLHEFSMSPPGFDPGASVTEVKLGEPVIVRWNVESASHVALESTLTIPPSGGPLFAEEVEHVGSRTFRPLREGLQSATLIIDRGAIRKMLLIGVHR